MKRIESTAPIGVRGLSRYSRHSVTNEQNQGTENEVVEPYVADPDPSEGTGSRARNGRHRSEAKALAPRWYEVLREEHRPSKVRLLLIGESAPDPGVAERRFFYASTLDRHDNLFRAVVEAMFESSPGRAGDKKAIWHTRLQAAGVYLIDLVPFPVDKRRPGERLQHRRDHVAACVHKAQELEPAGIIVCHAPTFDVLAEHLRRARLVLLHKERIPFPLGNHRSRFVAAFRAARRRLSSAGSDANTT